MKARVEAVRRLLEYSMRGKVAMVSGPVWKNGGGEKQSWSRYISKTVL